jgi:excisionase family DNA binding protein
MPTTAYTRAQKEFGKPRPIAPEPIDSASEIMTAEELAKYYRVTKQTITNQAAAGKIPGAFRIGKLWRFHRKKILAAA